jgi:hypothetical protein
MQTEAEYAGLEGSNFRLYVSTCDATREQISLQMVEKIVVGVVWRRAEERMVPCPMYPWPRSRQQYIRARYYLPRPQVSPGLNIFGVHSGQSQSATAPLGFFIVGQNIQPPPCFSLTQPSPHSSPSFFLSLCSPFVPSSLSLTYSYIPNTALPTRRVSLPHPPRA